VGEIKIMIHADTLKLLFPLELAGVFAGDIALEGAALDEAQASAELLLAEMFPDQADDLLTDWERICSITPASGSTLQARRDAVLTQIRFRAGQSRSFFIELAAAYGWTITIIEPQPFRAGESRCGDRIYIPEIVFVWRVFIPTVTVQPALEAILNELKPAHTFIEFQYETNSPNIFVGPLVIPAVPTVGVSTSVIAEDPVSVDTVSLTIPAVPTVGVGVVVEIPSSAVTMSIAIPAVPTVGAATSVIAEDPVSVDTVSLTIPAVPTVGASTSVATFTDAGAVTMSIASPCVVTKAGHGLAADHEIFFKTSGTLPTGIVQYTHYYVKDPAADTFNISATVGGAAINTSGSQSGTHNLWTKD
jgi:uncharacterized protein YmfQ (DUF2313 family)